ncbi:hypothetical protein Avbf_05580 [Armadillidium vulgare]|nr:hypothetical protein Avbf_05580 [Armadillidium vulgare]
MQLHVSFRSVEDVEETESVEELRQKLRQMKALVNERPTKKTGVDDGFLSIVFGLILFVIAFVTLYAFYNLYAAVHRRWYPPNEL